MFLQQLLVHSEQYPNLLLIANKNSKVYISYLLNKIIKRVIYSTTNNENDLLDNNEEIILSSKEEYRLIILEYGKFNNLLIPKKLQNEMDRFNKRNQENLIEKIDISNFQTINDLNQHIESKINNNLNYIVIIHPMSLLSVLFSEQEAFQLLFALLQKKYVRSVVSVLYEDTHSRVSLEQFKLHAQGIVSITGVDDLDADESYFFENGEDEDDVEEKILNLNQIHFRCNILSIRNGGKLLSNEEFYKVSSAIGEEEGNIVYLKDPYITKAKPKSTSTSVSIKQTDEDGVEKKSTGKGGRRHLTIGDEGNKLVENLTKDKQERLDRPMNHEDIESQVTFKIGLSDRERKAREKLDLPFMREGERFESNNTQQSQQGFIVIDEEEFEDEDADLEL
ncbi:hypothetical protein ABK040_014042 [Willaertia magna]